MPSCKRTVPCGRLKRRYRGSSRRVLDSLSKTESEPERADSNTFRRLAPRGKGACAAVLSTVALMLIASAPRHNAAVADVVRGDAPWHNGFSFSPGTCELGQEFCVVTTPRPWEPIEIALVAAALD